MSTPHRTLYMYIDSHCHCAHKYRINKFNYKCVPDDDIQNRSSSTVCSVYRRIVSVVFPFINPNDGASINYFQGPWLFSSLFLSLFFWKIKYVERRKGGDWQMGNRLRWVLITQCNFAIFRVLIRVVYRLRATIYHFAIVCVCVCVSIFKQHTSITTMAHPSIQQYATQWYVSRSTLLQSSCKGRMHQNNCFKFPTMAAF